MYKKLTITYLLMVTWSTFPLFAQTASGYYLKPRKHAFYLQGLFAVGAADALEGVALAGFNYEQAVYMGANGHFRLDGVVGTTPPLGEDINFITCHAGPKLFWGSHSTWLTVDAQYFGIIGKLDNDSYQKPTKVTYTNGGYLGIGYCYMGPRGFFFNPQFIIEGDAYYGNILLGANLGIGYCF